MSTKKNFCVWKDTTDVIGLTYSYARCNASLTHQHEKVECAFFVSTNPSFSSPSCKYFAFEDHPECLCSDAIADAQLLVKVEDI